MNEKPKQSPQKMQLLRRFNQRTATQHNQHQNDSPSKYFKNRKSDVYADIQQFKQNYWKLPKITLKNKPSKQKKNVLQNLINENRSNQTELLTKKNSKSFFNQNTNKSQKEDMFHLKNKSLQIFQDSSKAQIVGRRLLSEISQKQQIQRSMSNYSTKAKFLIGSKKPSLNFVKFPKNKSLLNDASMNLQMISALKNKLKQKNPFKQNNANTKQGSGSSKLNVFLSQNTSPSGEYKKDQFIQYLKNLHRQKIKSQVFRNKEIKQKQKQTKRRSP